MKKLIVLLAVLASGVVVDANGRSEAQTESRHGRSSRDDGPSDAVLHALRRACASGSREAAQNWCDLAFSR